MIIRRIYSKNSLKNASREKETNNVLNNMEEKEYENNPSFSLNKYTK
jgi:hypothetical protein